MNEETKEEIAESPIEAVVSEETQQAPPESPKEDKESVNWREARQVMSLQKKKIEELEQMVSQVTQKQVPQAEEEDEFDKLDPNDYLTVDKAKSLAKKQAYKAAKEISQQEIQKYIQETRVKSDDKRMKETHDDYDFVMENYAVPLIKNNPALANAIQNSETPAETAYIMAKMSTLYRETSAQPPANPQKAEKVLKNASRPVSAAAVGSPLKTQADNFSKMSKQDIWNMSQEYARGA